MRKILFILIIALHVSKSLALSNLSKTSFPEVPKGYETKISALILDNNTGQIVYEHNPDKPKLIASNMKLFTTIIGLKYLKPDFHWHTKLLYTGDISNNILHGDIYLKGGGDPTLDDKGIYQIFSTLKRLGIEKINGNIILDDSIFNTKPTFSMLENIPYDPDTSLPNGIVINHNFVQLQFNIINNKKVAINTNLYRYNIENDLIVDPKLTQCGDVLKSLQISTKDTLESINNSIDKNNLYQNIDNNINNISIPAQKSIALKGKISPTCNNTTINLNLLSNFDYNSMVIERVLNDFSINYSGKFIKGNTPSFATLVNDYSSNSLAEILINMNRFSDNLIAETTFLSIGTYDFSDMNTKLKNLDNYKNSSIIFNNFINKNHLNNAIFHLENGAGLSRFEYFSAKNLVDLLYLVSHSTLSSNFEATLPTPAQEGTLHNKFLQFKDVLHVKTGTLNDTRAYSGYFYTPNKNKYIISIIANNIDTKNNEQMVILDDWISELLYQLH